jgi:hypothetical protein
MLCALTLPPKTYSIADGEKSVLGEIEMIESKPRARYTLELKLEALKLVKGAGDKPVSPEQMELARLRAENARLRMERDILGKATAYFARVSK